LCPVLAIIIFILLRTIQGLQPTTAPARNHAFVCKSLTVYRALSKRDFFVCIILQWTQ
jgi:hypothetical protein